MKYASVTLEVKWNHSKAISVHLLLDGTCSNLSFWHVLCHINVDLSCLLAEGFSKSFISIYYFSLELFVFWLLAYVLPNFVFQRTRFAMVLHKCACFYHQLHPYVMLTNIFFPWLQNGLFQERAHAYYSGMSKDQFQKMQEFIAGRSSKKPSKL
jgi:hypothetical protein